MVKIKPLQNLETTSWASPPPPPAPSRGWEGEGDIFRRSAAFPLLFILFYTPCTHYIHLITHTHSQTTSDIINAPQLCVCVFNELHPRTVPEERGSSGASGEDTWGSKGSGQEVDLLLTSSPFFHTAALKKHFLIANI